MSTDMLRRLTNCRLLLLLLLCLQDTRIDISPQRVTGDPMVLG